MNNFFKSLFIITLSIFFVHSNVFAAVSSVDEIETEMDKIMQLNETDFGSFYNRSEMIGANKSSFNIVSSEYKLKNKASIDSLSKIISTINDIEGSEEFSDSDKNSQINELIQKANEELNKTSNNAINYVTNLGPYMPTITYNRFKTAFINYYNDLYINENQIEL